MNSEVRVSEVMPSDSSRADKVPVLLHVGDNLCTHNMGEYDNYRCCAVCRAIACIPNFAD